jgi:hypothetical protein
MTKKTAAILGLLITDLGILLATCVFLPRRGSWTFHGPVSNYINSRIRWDIAWGVLLSAIVVSIGVFFLMKAFGAFDQKDECIERDVDPNA